MIDGPATLLLFLHYYTSRYIQSECRPQSRLKRKAAVDADVLHRTRTLSDLRSDTTLFHGNYVAPELKRNLQIRLTETYFFPNYVCI